MNESERYKMNQRIDFEIDFTGLDGIDYTAGMVVTSPGDPGRYYGPPEKCYPAEDPEFEIITVSRQFPKGLEDMPPIIWSAILDDEIESLIMEKAVEAFKDREEYLREEAGERHLRDRFED
jgi:hypothetical protein